MPNSILFSDVLMHNLTLEEQIKYGLVPSEAERLAEQKYAEGWEAGLDHAIDALMTEQMKHLTGTEDGTNNG